jgi:hypothetical protein
MTKPFLYKITSRKSSGRLGFSQKKKITIRELFTMSTDGGDLKLRTAVFSSQFNPRSGDMESPLLRR